MAMPSADYRWQDHVPRLGLLDHAVVAITAMLLLAAAAGGPPDVRRAAGPGHDRIAARAADGCHALAAAPARPTARSGMEDAG